MSGPAANFSYYKISYKFHIKFHTSFHIRYYKKVTSIEHYGDGKHRDLRVGEGARGTFKELKTQVYFTG